MKILVIFCMTIVGDLVAQEPWELKPSPVSKEDKELGKKFEKLKKFLTEYASTGRKATQEDIQIIDEIYQNNGSSKLAIDAKSYSFATMVRVKDIDVWSQELPALLLSDSKQLAGSAIDAVYYVYKKGTRKEKLYLLKERKLQEQLNESLEKFDDENFAAKINKISELVKENKYLLDEPDTSQSLRGVRRGDKGEEPFGNDLVSKPKKQNETRQEISEAEQSPSRLPWIIAGVLLVGILALLFKAFKGKSTS